MWMHLSACVSFLDAPRLGSEQVFRPIPSPPPPPVLAVSHISNWLTDPLSGVLFSLPVFAVSSLHLLALWAGGKAPGSPIVPGKRRYRPNQSRLGKKNQMATDSQAGSWKTWLHVSPPLLAVSSIIPLASALPNSQSSSLTLASGSQSGLISFELHCV